MYSRATARHNSRLSRLDGNQAYRRQSFLKKSAHAHQRCGSANTANNSVDFSITVGKKLPTCSKKVSKNTRFVGKLAGRVAVFCIFKHFLCPAPGPHHPLIRRGQDQLCTVFFNHSPPLFRHVFRHKYDRSVAKNGRQHSQ